VDTTVVPNVGKSIGIIGAGPAGLALAYYMVAGGWRVTLFENNKIGGMLNIIHRMDIKRVMDFAKTLELMGVTHKREFDGAFDVVVAATGAGENNKLGIKGEELAVGALEYLACEPFVNVVVIGGGNVAIDCSLYSKGRVVQCYRKGEELLKAYPRYIKAAKDAGVEFKFNKVPLEINENGVLFQDGDFIEGKVIIAIGQSVTLPDVKFDYKIGDCVEGTKTIVEAIESARNLSKVLLT